MKTDGNQKQIVRDLKRAGFSVQSLGRVGEGCPDLLIGFRGRNWLVEIKSAIQEKPRENQKEWYRAWRGGKVIVGRTSDEIIKYLMGQV